MTFRTTATIVLLVLFAFPVASDSMAQDPDQQNGPIPGPTLREMTQPWFEMGVGTSMRAFTTPRDRELTRRQFAVVTPENCMKPAAVQNEEGKFRFDAADRFVKTATEHELAVVGHCLVWAKDDRTPAWFYLDGDKPASKQLLDKRMKQHIDTVIKRYGDRINEWDVVNEVLSDGGTDETYRKSQWLEIYGGPEFVLNAFRYARAAAPKATLIYNDYRSERAGKREKLIKLLKYLIENKAPIDAVGLQGHYELDDVPYKALQTTIDEIRKLGLKVIVSEVDIDVVKRGNWYAPNADREEIAKYDPYVDELPKEVSDKLSQQYHDLLELYLDNADVIQRVTFWNLHDGHSWLNYFPWKRTNHPLLFDRDGNSKPPFHVFRAVLHGKAYEMLDDYDRQITPMIPVGTTIPLWKNGAPGFEDRKDEPELAREWWVKNIHNPSLTVHLAPIEKRTGAAVVICPGGGHRLLVAGAEGSDAARYFNEIGVTAFVLKYRLEREENSPYKIDIHARQDGERAIRWVRHYANMLGVDAKRVGIVGFSAGGEVASMVTYGDHAGDETATDPVDRHSCRPDYQIAVYPGPQGIPEEIPEGSPKTFLLVSNDDGASQVVLDLTTKLRAAKVPVELHLFHAGGHGFNMGDRSKLKTINTWKHRLGDWMQDNGLLKN